MVFRRRGLFCISLFYCQISFLGKWFYGRFGGICQLQRTLILYPRNIPEFVLSEDILSLQKVSHCWGAATDFQSNKKLQVVEYHGTRSGDRQAATAAQSLSNASPAGRVTQGNQSHNRSVVAKNKSRKMRLYIFWYPERGSNPHVLFGQRILSPLRLPIPPSGRTIHSLFS